MLKYLALPVVACAALAMAELPAGAHHAVQASVDINVNVEAKGVLTKVDWINPHTWMRFDITKPDGTVEKNVMVESLGINALRQLGITSKEALKVGDVYTITYYPMRTGEPGGFMSRMVMPNGKVFDTSTADPTAVPAPARTQ
ncbi:MAG: DUF6152 family protein [Bauldia sp.]